MVWMQARSTGSRISTASGSELVSGKSLMHKGLELSLSDAPASAIVQYERQSGGSA